MSETFIKYLPVNDQAAAWQVYCTDAGFVSVSPGSPYPPFRESHPLAYRRSATTRRVLNEFQVLYITRGKGIFRSERSEERGITAGDVFFVFPGVWHAYSPIKAIGWDERWIGFDGRYVRGLVKEGFLAPESPTYRVGENARLLSLFAGVMSTARREIPGFQLLLGAAIHQIIAEVLTTTYQEAQEIGTDLTIKKARFYMEDHLYGVVHLPDLLDHLGISSSTLNRAFSKYTGMSHHQYFLQMKIMKAKELLVDPKVTIKEVALDLGFEDQYYFSRLFRRKTGTSPTEWRRGVQS